MTADAVERILRSVLKQYGLPFVVHQVAVVGGQWTVVLNARGAQTRLRGAVGSPYAVRAALLNALNVEQL